MAGVDNALHQVFVIIVVVMLAALIWMILFGSMSAVLANVNLTTVIG